MCLCKDWPGHLASNLNFTLVGYAASLIPRPELARCMPIYYGAMRHTIAQRYTQQKRNVALIHIVVKLMCLETTMCLAFKNISGSHETLNFKPAGVKKRFYAVKPKH